MRVQQVVDGYVEEIRVFQGCQLDIVGRGHAPHLKRTDTGSRPRGAELGKWGDLALEFLENLAQVVRQATIIVEHTLVHCRFTPHGLTSTLF